MKAMKQAEFGHTTDWKNPADLLKKGLLLISGGHHIAVKDVRVDVFEMVQSARTFREVFNLLAAGTMKEGLMDLSFGMTGEYIEGFCRDHHEFLGPYGTYTSFLTTSVSSDIFVGVVLITDKWDDHYNDELELNDLERNLYSVRPAFRIKVFNKRLDEGMGNFIEGERHLHRILIPSRNPDLKLIK